MSIEEPTSWKEKRVTKETTKKVKKGNKHNAIEIGKSLEEEEKMNKWKDFEVYHMIAIRKEMDLESTKTSNKQGIF